MNCFDFSFSFLRKCVNELTATLDSALDPSVLPPESHCFLLRNYANTNHTKLMMSFKRRFILFRPFYFIFRRRYTSLILNYTRDDTLKLCCVNTCIIFLLTWNQMYVDHCSHCVFLDEGTLIFYRGTLIMVCTDEVRGR